MVSRFAILCALLCILTACGGGSTGSVLPAAGANGGPAAPSSGGRQNVAVTIVVPAQGSAAASKVRRAAYVSSQTKSASVAANGGSAVVANLTAGSPNCTTTSAGLACTLTVAAPVGADTFTIILYSDTNGAGAVLSQGAAAATIVAGQANNVVLTLNGVVASIALSLSDANPPAQPTSVNLIVTVKDASNATIIGSDPFLTPIVLSDSDTSGATKLSKTTLTTPADASNVTIAYTGQPIANAVFSAAAGNVTAAPAVLTSAAVRFNDFTTFAYDNQRDGYNPNTTAITTRSVANLHLAWQKQVGDKGDYNVQSQPILATEIANHAGVLFLGGGSGDIYAHDALTGKSLWTVHTGQETYSCDPANPNQTFVFGIGGTAAYDPASRSLYIVANKNGASGSFAQNLLLHVDGASGATLGSYDFGQGQAGSTELNFSHTSVTLNNGIAYVGTGATCDISSWRGRVAAVSVPSMSLARTFFTTWDPAQGHYWGGGGVWGWGGVSIDYNGNVLAGIGNTDNGSSTQGQIVSPFVASPAEYSGYGETLLQLSGDLSNVLAYQHPIPQSAYAHTEDLDVNGTPVVFKPLGGACSPLVALQSKAGALLIYNETNIGSGPIARYQFAPSTYADGFLGVTAYSGASGLLYSVVASNQSPDFLAPGMVAVDPHCGSPSIAWHASFGPDGTPQGLPRSVPAASAGGVVFVASPCDGTPTCGSIGTAGAIWELDASTGQILNNGSPILHTGSPVRAPVTIDGNWVYVVDLAGNLYGLTIDSHYATVAATQRTASTRFFNRMTARPLH